MEIFRAVTARMQAMMVPSTWYTGLLQPARNHKGFPSQGSLLPKEEGGWKGLQRSCRRLRDSLQKLSRYALAVLGDGLLLQKPTHFPSPTSLPTDPCLWVSVFVHVSAHGAVQYASVCPDVCYMCLHRRMGSRKSEYPDAIC